jgi:hypothetical protein
MPFGIIHHFPGGTEKQYDATLSAVHVSDTELPEGRSFTLPGLRATAGPWWRFTIRRPAGMSSVIRSLCHASRQVWREALPRRPRNRPWRCTSSSGSTPQRACLGGDRPITATRWPEVPEAVRTTTHCATRSRSPRQGPPRCQGESRGFE